jgi:hypothetical protein
VLNYRGTPRPTDDSLILAHAAADDDVEARLSNLRARLADPADLDARVELWVCLNDPTTPLVRIKLAELLALGGERPLNVAVPAGAVVLLVLELGEAAWPATASKLEVDVT